MNTELSVAGTGIAYYRIKGTRYDLILTDIERGVPDAAIKDRYGMDSATLNVYRKVLTGKLSKGLADGESPVEVEPPREPKPVKERRVFKAPTKAELTEAFRGAPRIPSNRERLRIPDPESFEETLLEVSGETSMHSLCKRLELDTGTFTRIRYAESICAQTVVRLNKGLGIDLYGMGLVTLQRSNRRYRYHGTGSQ